MRNGSLRMEEIKMARECCGTCRHCRKSEETGDWICTNDLSDNYALEVDYKYKCEEHEEKE